MNNTYKILTMMKLRGITAEVEEEELKKMHFDAELISGNCSNEDELIEIAQDADIILGGGYLFTRRVIEKLRKCQAIITYSVGFDGIDIDAATENGVLVINNPASEWCIEEVSNHAIALLLASAKNITSLNNTLKSGEWDRTKNRLIMDIPSLHGKTLGLVGCGAIARMVARKAQCFGLNVIGYDPLLREALFTEYSIMPVSLNQLIEKSDFISMHAPLNEQTRHMIGEGEFREMKSEVIFINTGRGGLVDEKALVKALQEKWIAGAGIDVFEKEPIEKENPLFRLENVIVTPHSASFSKTSLLTQPVNPIREAVRVLQGRWPKNVVNSNVKSKMVLKKDE